jgi:hypothetical protein
MKLFSSDIRFETISDAINKQFGVKITRGLEDIGQIGQLHNNDGKIEFVNGETKYMIDENKPTFKNSTFHLSEKLKANIAAVSDCLVTRS